METQVLDAPISTTTLTVARPDLLYRVVLGVLLVVSVGVRLFGIGWGIPNFDAARMPTSAYRNSYHIDEDNFIWGLMQMRPSEGNFDIVDYHWGTLQFFLIDGVFLGAEATGILPAPWETAFRDGDISAIGTMYELGRLISVAAGVAGVFIIVALGTLAGGRRAGLGAGVAYALAPLAVVEAHYLTNDIVMSVLVAASLLAAARGAQRGHLGWLLAAGLLLGLAISDKYSASFAAPAILLAQLFAWRTDPERRDKLLPSLSYLILPWLAVLSGFVLGEPYLLFVPGKLIAGIHDTMNGNAADPSLGLAPAIDMLKWQAENLGWLGLTLPLAILALGGILIMIARCINAWRTTHRANRQVGQNSELRTQNSEPGKATGAILLAALFGLILSLALNRIFMLRYSQPLLPILSVAAGVGWASIPRPTLRWTAGVVAVVVAGLITLGQLSLLAGPHPANELLAWLDTNLKPGQQVARLWPEYPPLDGGSIKLIRLDPWHAVMPAGADPDYIIMDNMALGPPDPTLTDLITTKYREVVTFTSKPQVGPFTWDEGVTPHDWKYSHPTFTVYARR